MRKSSNDLAEKCELSNKGNAKKKKLNLMRDVIM